MPSLNLLFIPLIAGYYILSNLVYFKYKYERQETRRLLLSSAIAGLFIGLFAILIRYFFESMCPEVLRYLYSCLGKLLDYHDNSLRFLWTMVLAFVGVILITHLINFIVRLIPRHAALLAERAVSERGNELEKLFTYSVLHKWPIQVTLKNEKVYLGFIDRIPIPSATNYFELVPLYSGYEDPSNKALTLTMSYETVSILLNDDWHNEQIAMMVIVIKQDEVLTASPHVHEAYSRYYRMHHVEN